MLSIRKSRGLALSLLVAWGSARSEESWLEAEVRAQEARWAAQQDKTPPLRPAVSALPTAQVSKSVKSGERDRSVYFPALAALRGARGAIKNPDKPNPGPAFTSAASRERLNAVSHLILASADRHQVDPLLVRAVILTESSGRQTARSPKGAIGLMQLMPRTASRFGVTNPFDPDQNIAGGTRYLRWLLNRYGGNVALALAGYNAGEGAVDRYGGIPPYRETREYVWRVRITHAALGRVLAQKLAGSESSDGKRTPR